MNYTAEELIKSVYKNAIDVELDKFPTLSDSEAMKKFGYFIIKRVQI